MEKVLSDETVVRITHQGNAAIVTDVESGETQTIEFDGYSRDQNLALARLTADCQTRLFKYIEAEADILGKKIDAFHERQAIAAAERVGK